MSDEYFEDNKTVGVFGMRHSKENNGTPVANQMQNTGNLMGMNGQVAGQPANQFARQQTGQYVGQNIGQFTGHPVGQNTEKQQNEYVEDNKTVGVFGMRAAQQNNEIPQTENSGTAGGSDRGMNVKSEQIPIQQQDDIKLTQGETSIHVVLFEMDGDMQELFLPAKAEGRYQLYRGDGSSEVIINIVATNGQWEAVGCGNGRFLINANTAERRIRFLGEKLINFTYKEEMYFFYAETVTPVDSLFVPYYVGSNAEISIGRKEDQDIYYPSDMVSREHALIYWQNDGWWIKDRESQNGVYVNGKRILNAPVKPGDTVYIMGLYIIFGVGFIAMNNANNRVMITSLKLGKIGDVDSLYYPVPQKTEESERYFDRLPRRVYEYKPIQIPVEAPPMPLPKNGMPMLLNMANPMISGGAAILSGNPLMAVTSMLLPMMTHGYSEKEKKEYEEKRQAIYSEYLGKISAVIQAEKKKEETELNKIYPNLETVLNFATEKERLWERRRYDNDYLKVRLGSGNIPLLSTIDYPQKRLQMEEDALQERMYNFVEQKVILEDAPVMLSLRDDFVIGIRGERASVLEQISHMIMQLSLTHSYDDVKIILLVRPEEADYFNFLRYLHHNWDNEKTVRFFCTSKSDAQAISKVMNKEIENLEDAKTRNANDFRNRLSYVVFALDKELYDCIEAFKVIQESESYMTVSIVAAYEGMPKECNKIIVADDKMQLIDLKLSEDKDTFYRLDNCDMKYAEKQMEALYSTEIRLEDKDFVLPNMITFLELYNAGRVEHLNPLGRWKENNPVRSLAVPLGVGTDGKPFMLDLHEKYHGPHGLIAGGTGSGKSEFIITYILSLALNFSPDEVAFILIDYKGGGLADAFVDSKKGIHLPHVVGTITNLDGSAISRSLLAINSEIKRRQSVFKVAKSQTNEGTMDIYDYQKLYRAGAVAEPMPHLFIISDEFAELKKNQPEFMDELISIARIGRSLGVHLILATQKPTGVVNDQIWSNTKFRICLRVADKSDSMEMLKRPEAAEIRLTGRFYLQVGYNELFEMGQSAWCGAKYAPQEETIEEVDQSVEFVDNVGQTFITVQPPKNTQQTGVKQIVVIVQYLSDLAKREHIIPRKLWTDPLPAKMELDAVAAKYPHKEDGSVKALLGVIDDPEHQCQYPYFLDMQSFHHLLICAPSGAGKSCYIKTMLFNLVDHYSPEDVNYYIVDLSGGGLLPYASLPHCGAYLSERNEADLRRLLTLISEIIEERKTIFAEAEVSNFDAYRKVAKMPVILVVFDGFSNIQNWQVGVEYYSEMYEYLRNASPYGVKYVVAINHLNEIHTRARQEVDYRVAMQAKDKYEYQDIMDVKCPITVPQMSGRGIVIYEDRPLEFHTALWNADADEQEQNRALKEHFMGLRERYSNSPIAKTLPMVEDGKTYEDFHRGFSEERFPLGYYRTTMKPVAIPFQQLSTMTLYFGNPVGVAPVLGNLLYSAGKNNMEVIAYKRGMDSIFVGADLNALGSRNITVKDTTLPEMEKLIGRLKDEISARNAFRDQYCERNGISKNSKKRVQKAAKYIRENTKPLLILFEGLGDLCRLAPDEETDDTAFQDINATLKIFFEGLKGYNIYFMGALYPSDKDSEAYSSEMMKGFTSNQLCMLFGGVYKKADFLQPLPTELYSSDKMDERYDNCILKYDGKLYPMRMPCGELLSATGDPDEASII